MFLMKRILGSEASSSLIHIILPLTFLKVRKLCLDSKFTEQTIWIERVGASTTVTDDIPRKR